MKLQCLSSGLRNLEIVECYGIDPTQIEINLKQIHRLYCLVLSFRTTKNGQNGRIFNKAILKKQDGLQNIHNSPCQTKSFISSWTILSKQQRIQSENLQTESLSASDRFKQRIEDIRNTFLTNGVTLFNCTNRRKNRKTMTNQKNRRTKNAISVDCLILQ